MTFSRLCIQDLRNIESCDLNFSAGFNFLVGPNGSGKTSVLEAIYYLGHGRSFRSHLTGRVIRHQQERFVVHGRIQVGESLLPVGIQKNRDGTTEVKIGQDKGQKLCKLAEVLPMQLITPEGFDLVTGGPKFRRAFIDWGVFHVEPQFYPVWSRVKRLTKQRNALLKTARSYRELSYWDAELVPLANQIDQWRKKYIANFSKLAASLSEAFLPEYEIKIGYSRGWDKDTDYAKLLEQNFFREQQLGYTVSGPHKSDLRLKVGTIPVEDILSRGQLKLMVCALRLAQGQQLSKEQGKQCIYLLDDFASELDSQRRSLLITQLKATGMQVFISAISADQVAEIGDENSKMFHVENGKITEV